MTTSPVTTAEQAQEQLERFRKKLLKIDPVTTYQPGDLFQVQASYGEDGSRSGWVGAVLVATEIKHWGFVGYHHQLHEHTTRGKVWTRMEWAHVEFVGSARIWDEEVNYGE